MSDPENAPRNESEDDLDLVAVVGDLDSGAVLGSASGYVVCAVCKQESSANDSFCSNCGAR